MKKAYVLLPLVLVFIFVSQQTVAQAANAEAGIEEIMQQNNVIGLSVAVVKNGKIIYTHSFGSKDVESNTALTDDCLFRIASISKSFSATSIMQLVEAKKLSLDDDISKLVGLPSAIQNFLKQLLRCE